MSIFVIFNVSSPEKMGPAIMAAFPDDCFELKNGEWLVSAKGTAKEVSDKIGISADPALIGSAIVFGMEGYFGRSPANIWDWIKSKLEATNG